MCELSFDGSIDCWNEKEVTARFAHVCDCCGGAIAKGERYRRIFYASEGTASAEKQCMPCVAMDREFSRVHGTSGAPAYMPELLQLCIDEEGKTSEMGVKWTAELAAMAARRAARAAQPEVAS